MKTALIAMGGGLVGAAVLWLFQGHTLRLIPVEMTYADLAATMLGATAIILTALGLVIGVLALWGYSQFKTLVQTAAVDHVKLSAVDGEIKATVSHAAETFINKELEAGSLRTLLEARVDEIILKGASSRAGEEETPEGEFEDADDDH